jgi:glycosyltransferase involved in cell wall biosynthesis
LATEPQTDVLPERPRVSVIVPCRNAAAWLAETLASVLIQTGPSLEVIVVDDGSDDASPAVAEAAGPQIRLLRQPPRGVSAARNAGTAAATGEFLQYLDADDLLEPSTLAARVLALETSGADIALTPWVRWKAGADGVFRAGEVEETLLGPRPDIDLLTDAWWPPGAVLYRRAIVDRIGGWREDLPIIQDARFLLDSALEGGRFTQISAVGLRYREHEQSLSRRDPLAFATDCYRSAADLEWRWTRAGTLDPARRHALVRVYAHVARATFTRDRALFDEAYRRATRLDPAFQPDGPPALRLLSSWIGYHPAEHVASWWRASKRLGTAIR